MSATIKLIQYVFLLAAYAIPFSAAFSQQHEPVSYEVCTSPGCLADGARETINKMQALAPPGVIVKPGDCCSLCGNGPIVMKTGGKYVSKNKNVKSDSNKLLDLLTTTDGEGSNPPLEIPEKVIQGYDLSVQARGAYDKGLYREADELYERAIDTAFRPAMEVQAIREKSKSDNLSRMGIPVGLLWLVNARQNQASARLALGDVDGAVLAAQASCNLARNRCPKALEVLAEVYQKKGDLRSELQAIKNMFDLPVDETKLPRQVANRRRELGFRRTKLQNELGKN